MQKRMVLGQTHSLGCSQVKEGIAKLPHELSTALDLLGHSWIVSGERQSTVFRLRDEQHIAQFDLEASEKFLGKNEPHRIANLSEFQHRHTLDGITRIQMGLAGCG